MVIMILRFLFYVSFCVRFSSVVLWETYITNRNGRKLKDTRSVHKKTLIVMRNDESFFTVRVSLFIQRSQFLLLHHGLLS